MAHQFPFIDTDHSQAANTIANLRADYAQFGVDSSVNLNLAGVGTFSNTVSFGATVNVTGTLVDDSTQVGAAGSILSSTGSGIRWVPAGEGNTASASNVGTNLNATDADQFVAFLGSNSGNNPVRVDAGLTYNPSTNILKVEDIQIPDLGKIQLGGSQDLELYHTTASGGYSAIVDGGTGQLIIGSNLLEIKNAALNETYATFTGSSSCNLNFNTVERIRTADGGVVVTGICTATTFIGALTGDVTGNTSGSSGSCTGNAATATALETARTIGGTSFDGSADITPGVAGGLSGTPSIAVTNIDIAGTLTDKNDAVGTSGQILTSTADGVAWASVGDQAAEVAVTNEATDTTCFPVFALKATGTDIELKSNTAFKFNSDTGELEASKFAISSGTSNQFLKGDGSVDTTTYLSSIADEAITLAKIQHIDTSRILGRTSANAGDVEVLAKADVLTLLNVADGAEVNVQSDWNASSGDALILNKPTLVTAFTGLSDTPASLTASKFVKVNAAANALEFVDDPNTNTTYDLLVPESTTDIRLDPSSGTNDDITITGGTNVTVTRTSGTELTFSSVNTNTFTGLTDTPANYTNSGSKLVAVKSDASGLEYVSAGTGADVDTFLELTDTPGSFTASKFVKVNAAGNALEFGDDNNTTYGAVSTSAAGLAPQLPASHGGKFLKADATWEVPPNTTYGLVSTSANGLAPQLPATHGDKFLKADGSWEVPAYTTDTNTTYTLPAGGTDGTNYTDAKGSATIVLTDNAGTPNTDTVTITAGTNIKIDSTGVGGFTINAQDTNTTYSNFTGANGSDAGSAGLVIQPAATDNVKFLKGDGTWATPTNTTYSNFTGANGSDAGSAGLVLQPAATDNTKFLKGDGTWATPTDTTYSNFTGADGSNAGSAGLVIQPAATDNTKFLKGDGTWATPSYIANTWRGIDDTPADGVTTESISSNWAFDHAAASGNGGHIPAAGTGNSGKFLANDGTWKTPSYTTNTDTTYTFSSGLTNTSGTVRVDAAVQSQVVGASGNTNTFTVDTVALSAFHLLEYSMYLSHSTAGIQACKLLVMDNGSTPYCSEYAVMYSGSSSLGLFSCTTSGSNILVQFSPVNSATSIRYIKQVIE